MSTYRKEWDCCDSVTETQAWEPETCPFCASPAAAVPEGAWHEAALAECMKIEAAYHPTDPARTLKELIDWHVQEASGVAQGVKIMADNYVRLTCATSTVPEGALPPLRMTEQEAFALAIQSGRADKFIFRIPGTMKSHKVECAVLEPADALKFARAAVEADRAQRPENANQPLCDSALRAEPAGTGFLTIGWREALEKLRPDTTTHTHDTEIADAVLDEVIDALDDLEESQRCAAPHEQGNLGEMFIVAGGKWDGVRWVVENSDLATFMRSVLAAGAARQGGDGAPEAVSADRAQQGEPVAVEKINMTQAGVGERARGYCAGWNDCIDEFSRAATKAAAPADAPILANGMPVENVQMDWVCHYISENTVFDGKDILRAWNALVAFYVANRAAPVPATGIPTVGEDELSLQQVADLIDGKGIMSPAEFRRFLNGDGVEMFPHQIAFMCNLFSGRAPVSTTPTSGEVEQAEWKHLPEDPTTEMLQAACDAAGYLGNNRWAHGYRAMFAAAPSHPSEAKAGEDA